MRQAAQKGVNMIRLNPAEISNLKNGLADRDSNLVENVIREVRGYLISDHDMADTMDVLDMIVDLIDDLKDNSY